MFCLYQGPGETIPDRIGIFGNSPENDTSQWIEIINEGMPADFTSPSSSSPSSSSSSCDNMVSGVSVKILYAREGSVTDPQAKIVGVWRQFKSRKVSLKKGEVTRVSKREIMSWINQFMEGLMIV